MVMLRRGHCDATARCVGIVGTVLRMTVPDGPAFCGGCGGYDVPARSTWVVVDFGGTATYVARTWLIVIDPPARMKDETRDEELTV
jgi:hypothetical protein